MVTAKGEEIDRVVGFEVGADDYVVKPFPVESDLRIKAPLRRHAPAEMEVSTVVAGIFRIQDRSRCAPRLDCRRRDSVNGLGI